VVNGIGSRTSAARAIAATDQYTQHAYDVSLTGRAQRTVNLDEEKPAVSCGGVPSSQP